MFYTVNCNFIIHIKIALINAEQNITGELKNCITLKIVSLSQGNIDTKSITSQFILNLLLANCATSNKTWTCVPQPINVIASPEINCFIYINLISYCYYLSEPSIKISAFPIGNWKSLTGTSSTAALYNVFGSNIIQGSGSLAQASNRPLAFIGPLGTTIYKITFATFNYFFLYITYFETWRMSEITFGTLGMIKGSMPYCTTRSSYCQFSAIKLITASIPVLGRFIHNLN